MASEIIVLLAIVLVLPILIIFNTYIIPHMEPREMDMKATAQAKTDARGNSYCIYLDPTYGYASIRTPHSRETLTGFIHYLGSDLDNIITDSGRTEVGDKVFNKCDEIRLDIDSCGDSIMKVAPTLYPILETLDEVRHIAVKSQAFKVEEDDGFDQYLLESLEIVHTLVKSVSENVDDEAKFEAIILLKSIAALKNIHPELHNSTER